MKRKPGVRANERKQSSAEIGFGRRMNEQHPGRAADLRVRLPRLPTSSARNASPLLHRCFFPSLVSTSHVFEQESWEVLRFPAIAEADEAHQIETIRGPRTFKRRHGEALHPDREPLDTLDRIRRTVGEYNFAGQYQQAPAPLGGGLVKMEWFKRYRETEVPERFDRIMQSWDTANKATELSDFSVCTTWGKKDRQLYLLHVLRKRLDYPDLKHIFRGD